MRHTKQFSIFLTVMLGLIAWVWGNCLFWDWLLGYRNTFFFPAVMVTDFIIPGFLISLYLDKRERS